MDTITSSIELKSYHAESDDITNILIWQNNCTIYHWFTELSDHGRIRKLEDRT
jgi:hypothetical protein